MARALSNIVVFFLHLIGGSASLLILSAAEGANRSNVSTDLKPAVNPFNTSEEFSTVAARYVRFSILKANAKEPGLDEVEVFSAETPGRNVALLSAGARITASGHINGTAKFAPGKVGDGVYGRQSLWVAEQVSDVWLEIEFPQIERINRILWSRDRTKRQWDRTPIDYRIEVAEVRGEWKTVARSEERAKGLGFSPLKVPRSVLGEVVDSRGERRVPVRSFLNVEEFSPLQAQFVRFRILDTLGQDPYLDEIEVFALEDGEERNVALASLGSQIVSSNEEKAVEAFYQPKFLIDGEYGNDSRWKAETTDGAWIEIELAQVYLIHRIVWSRDRTEKWFDGVPVKYEIEVASERNSWKPIVSSEDRQTSNVIEIADRPRSSTDYVIDSWSEEEGISLDSINALAQTPDGYLWIGTDQGLLRFDGNQFTLFHRGNTPALSTSKIYSLYVDHLGRMWIANRKFFYDSNNNLVLFEGEQFRRVELPEAEKMMSVFEEQSGQLWLVTNQAAYPWRDDRIDMSRALLDFDISTSQYLGNGQKPEGKRRWSGRPGRWLGDEFVPAFGPDGPVLPREGKLGRRPQFARRDGGAWIVHGGLEGERPPSLNQWRRLEPDGTLLPARDFPWASEPTTFDTPLVDRNDNLWLADRKYGLQCLFADGESHESFAALPGLGKGSVRRLFEDRAGDLWIGTAKMGLRRLRRRLFHSVGAEQGMVTKSMTAIPDNVYSVSPAAEGEVWIGTHASNAYLSRDKNLAALWNSAGATWSVLEDSKGNVWTGAYGQGVRRHKKHELTILPTVSPHPFALFEDSEGKIWTGGDFGLSCLSQGLLQRYVPPDFDNGRFEWIISLAESEDGAIWAGSKLGFLYRFQGGQFQTHLIPERGSEYPVCAFYFDSFGALWFARFGFGLTRYQDGEFVHFTESDGLPTATINGILQDKKGYLWLSSKQGVYRISQDHFQQFGGGDDSQSYWEQYTESDGLPSDQCNGEQNQPSLCQTSDGRIWVPTLKGVGVIDPRDLGDYGAAPPVVIQSVTLFGPDSEVAEHIPGRELDASDEDAIASLTIPPGNKSLIVRYTAMEFSEPKQVHFRYRIVGLDDDWVEAENERAALIASLRYGDYRFEVMAENHLGRESNVASLNLIVEPYWWETRAFRMCVALLLIAGGVGGYQRRVMALERRNQIQEEFARQLIDREESERKRLAQEMHDGLGHELLLVRNRALDGAEAPMEEASDRFNVISDMVGNALENARSMAFNLRPFELDRIGFKNAVEAMIDKLAQSSDARYFRDIDDLEGLLPDSALVYLYRLIQEGMNNIMKHAQSTMVLLEIKVEDGCVRLQLEDDGVGFDTKKPSSGMGLSGMEERVRLINGTFHISSVPGKGTRLRIEIPV